VPHEHASLQPANASLDRSHELSTAGHGQHCVADLSGVTGLDRANPALAAFAGGPLQPASPGANADAAVGKRGVRKGRLASPPSVVVDRSGLGGDAWPGSSAGGSSVGEEGPQVRPLLALRSLNSPPNISFVRNLL
jgi:hypothetical protein